MAGLGSPPRSAKILEPPQLPFFDFFELSFSLSHSLRGSLIRRWVAPGQILQVLLQSLDAKHINSRDHDSQQHTVDFFCIDRIDVEDRGRYRCEQRNSREEMIHKSIFRQVTRRNYHRHNGDRNCIHFKPEKPGDLAPTIHASLSMIVATPCPPPTQAVAKP